MCRTQSNVTRLNPNIPRRRVKKTSARYSFTPELFSYPRETAIIYCEGHFGKNNGKTANGLVRISSRFDILCVIDSTLTGQDSGSVLDGIENGIPIVQNLEKAVMFSDKIPDYFIFGLAPSNGKLSFNERNLLIEAMSYGMNILNGLHEFLSDEPQFVRASRLYEVHIEDVRRPRNISELQMLTGRVTEVHCPRILVMGTDCAVGKRTTANILTTALRGYGLNAVMVATGQTSLMQGSVYGTALDSVPSQFCAGELEAVIIDAYEIEHPDVIVIEGQGALSHPSFCTSASIIRGSCPNAIIMQHVPSRVYRSGTNQVVMPNLAEEITLVELFSSSPVISITLNNEGIEGTRIIENIKDYTVKHGLPVTDLFFESEDELLSAIIRFFPDLKR
ncbi:DUF1611 domain-containing protein [Vibrio sp. vnigr-6D03]|uniref:DUF1611 domain-containing protein n=1 Tax=Vibrio sp. vnigr-6D03 TaxID=2058088 RepID=UPI000C327121|nr:DUF1611 domain-containing protein [Vibrio sp. vnigr-6D03]PKF78194.1 DUF1611 domain-containing protein [Vibrio sp. vnigr-6D03]